jgi:hypothetical protein
MSDYGIQVQRSAGKIQIDGTHQNYAVYKTGTETKIANDYWFNITLLHPITLDYVLTECPFIAVNVDDTDGAVVENCVAQNAYCYFEDTVYHAYTNAKVTTGTGAMSIPWMVIAAPHGIKERYGLKIFSPDGDSVFASWENYIEIVGVHTFSLAAGDTNADNTTNVTVVDAVNNYFILMPTNYKWLKNWAVAAWMKYWSMGMGKISSTSIRVHSAVQIGTAAEAQNWVVGNCWDSNCQLIEIAPVRAI